MNGKRYWLAGMLAGLIAQGCGTPPAVERKQPMNPEVRYWSNMAAETLPLELVISPEGVAVLKVPTNRGAEPAGMVGFFSDSVKRRSLKGLLAALQADEFAAIRPPENLSPGTAVRELTLKDPARGEIVKWHGGGAVTPPAFAAAEKAALAVVAEVRDKPVRALGLEVGQLPAGLPRGKPTDVAVVLANGGAEMVRLPHPSAWQAQGGELVMNGVRSDVPPNKMEPWHQRFESFGPDDVRQVRADAADAEVIRLAPGGKVRLECRKTFDWPPGPYRVSWYCRLPMANAEGGEVMVVEVVSKAFEVQSIGEVRPDDEPSEDSAAGDTPEQ